MVRKKDSPENSRIDYGAIIVYIFLIMGIFLLVNGSVGFVLSMLLYSKIYDDEALLTGLYFLHFYMIVLGMTLIFYHKKIIIKSHRT